MKKSLFSIFILSASLVSPSEACSQKPSFTGVYAGIGIGYSQETFTRSEELEQTVHYDPASAFSKNKNSSSKKYLLSTHIGYDHQFNNDYVLGSELSLNIHPHSHTFRNNVVDNTHTPDYHKSRSTLKNPFSVNLLFKAGKVFNHHMLYLIAGTALNKFDIENINKFVGSGGQPYQNHKKTTKYILNAVIGVGHSYTVDRWRFDTVMLYQPPRKISAKRLSINPTGIESIYLNTSYKASQVSFLVKASIKI